MWQKTSERWVPPKLFVGSMEIYHRIFPDAATDPRYDRFSVAVDESMPPNRLEVRYPSGRRYGHNVEPD